MIYKAKGIITAICGIETTNGGVALQKLHFEVDGDIFYPVARGTKIEILQDFLPGDVAEMEFKIVGNISVSGGTFNNVFIETITRV